jgi:hypothetical protein
MTGKE